MLAYAVDESVEGATRSIDISIRPDGSVQVADDGRGTDTRCDAEGAWQVKPVMATRDLRFFDVPGTPVLVDGVDRSGMSVVAALSSWLEHVNVRVEGAWTARYQHGLPVGSPSTYDAAPGATGTVVRFLPDPEVYGTAGLDVSALGDLIDQIRSPAHIRLAAG